MLAFKTLGGCALLGILSSVGNQPAAAADAPQTMNKVRVVDETEPDNETSIGKTTQSLREIPQSVTIVDRERLDQQAFTSLPELMKYVPGVNVIRFDGIGLFVSARSPTRRCKPCWAPVPGTTIAASSISSALSAKTARFVDAS